MRDLKDIERADNGGSSKPPAEEQEELSQSEISHRQAVKWWENFAEAVEDPHTSTYDFLKGTFLKKFDAEDAEGIGEFLTKAQQKAIKEVLALTDLRELSKTIERFESNRLIFHDPRIRISIKCARVLIDTYVSAKDEYEEDLKKRLAKGQGKPSEAEQEEEIKRLVEKKLAEPDVAESIEAVAEAYTGKDKKEIHKTVEEASKQLREGSSLSKIADDVIGVSKKYLTLDNAINIGVHALPLITWQYRWAIAIVFGAYVSRMAAVHGFKAAKAQLWDGNKEQAKEEGNKALTALKAAGGNVLAIGISPLVGKLPAKLAIWGTWAASTVYNKTLEITQKILEKKKEVAPEGVRVKAADKAIGTWNWIKKFFKDNADTLVILVARAAKAEKPGQVTNKFEKASQRVLFSRVKRITVGVWGVGMAASKRLRGKLKSAFGTAAAKDTDTIEVASEDALQAAEEREGEIEQESEESSDTNNEFNGAAEGADETEIEPVEPVIEMTNIPDEPPHIGGPS